MSDDDLIRRGDVLALQDRFMGVVCVKKIAALPAAAVAPIADVLDLQIKLRAAEERIAALDLTPQPAPDVARLVEALEAILEICVEPAETNDKNVRDWIEVTARNALAAMEGK